MKCPWYYDPTKKIYYLIKTFLRIVSYIFLFSQDSHPKKIVLKRCNNFCYPIKVCSFCPNDLHICKMKIFARYDHQWGLKKDMCHQGPTTSKTWKTNHHLHVVCQHHSLGSRHLHDSQRHHTGSTNPVLWTLGLGNHLQDFSAPSHLLQIPLLCCSGWNLEEHLQDQGVPIGTFIIY